MKDVIRIISAAFILMNAFCFCMDTQKKMLKLEVLKDDRRSKVVLDRDTVFCEIAPRVHIHTQRNLRATCHYGKANVRIDELEKGLRYLAAPLTFCSVWIGGAERPNHSLSDFNNLKKIFELTEIEGNSPREAKALRSSLVNAIAPWSGARDDSNHGKRTGLYLLTPLYQEDHKNFALQLKEQHFYNRSHERDEYCAIS